MTAARKRMTADEFLTWALDQEDKYELVDGLPVPKHLGPEMMANGMRRHARVISNLVQALGRRLEGGPCEVYSDVFAVRTAINRQRRPDVIVDCGPGAEEDLEATAPTVLFEVLSPSSQRADLLIKPEEYKRIETVRQYVVIDPEVALARVWTRDADGRWSDDKIEGLIAVLDLPSLGCGLPMTEIYRGVRLLDEPQ